MTLSDLLSLASATLTAPTTDERAALGLALARGVMERLGESQPCGMDEPEVTTDGGVTTLLIPEQWRDCMAVDPTDADHMARLLFKAADSARAERESTADIIARVDRQWAHLERNGVAFVHCRKCGFEAVPFADATIEDHMKACQMATEEK